jgi:hypothetical protein
MKLLICLMLGLPLAASLAVAGELYGTIVDGGKPVPEGLKVEIAVGENRFAGETDKIGAYHIFAADRGKGTLTIQYKDHKLTADIFSYERATRYDWTVETVDGKMTLKRK